MSLTLLANRAPVRRTEDGWAAALGGLATALLPVLEQRGGAWVAMGAPDEGAPERQPFPEEVPRFTIHRVPLSEAEVEGYYDGMANRVLWPITHYLIEHTEPHRLFSGTYRAVNERFARAALEAAGPGDLFWVHDYHLMLVPALLRRACPEAAVGHFWHVPWPAPEVFRILPTARSLLAGLLGADLVGFHTEGYAENFRESARDLLGARVEGEAVLWQGRRVRAEAHPIGIDVGYFGALGADAETGREARALREGLDVERLVVAVDRLDYTKGLLLRLDAFERFLRTHPEQRGRVSLLQVATPSRTGIESYDQLKREVDEAVGRINGAFAEGQWVPIHYRYRAYPQEELAVLYRAADVALITPLRDGMNLVAHEFAATSQPDRPAVVVLSELTGSADYLDGAVLVNPYDTEGLPEALREALAMPLEERRRRLSRLKAAVRRLDVHAWAGRFLAALHPAGERADAPSPGGDGHTVSVPRLASVAP
ncbi:MAG TPA: trehalose-6-phosphate synthase [Rubricoccaceae bacterium]|nr:trehalose-6-phosphate synthase [Rubricoccaceae bacterium]